MEAMVILLLTVALAAGVVWWVTVGGLPLFFVGRRNGGSTADPTFASRTESPGGSPVLAPSTEPNAEESTGQTPDPSTDVAAVPTAATRWPRPVLEPAPVPIQEKTEERRRSPVRHRSSRSTFTYAQTVQDSRPPFVLTLLRLVFGIAVVAGLIAGGIWALGQFVNSFISKLFGE